MMKALNKLAPGLLILLCVSTAWAGDSIPKAAWKRGIGEPLQNPGGRKPALAASGMIDDGYWQGAPVGGFGSGTFSIRIQKETPKAWRRC
jgi:non-lysosomal glucosylceramidase